jgi:2-polyprenyl-3-methyl-5-hydroxy-6-metoxy-1,4-benzoquinol methylase
MHNKCLICNSSNLLIYKGYEKVHLCKCGSCGFVFSQKKPTKEVIEKYYENYGLDDFISPITIKRYHEILDEFESFRKTNRILDVGCGTGYFLNEAKKRGWDVYGTEISQKSVDICSSKGITMKTGFLNAADYEPNSFDVILSIEVIEHINNPQDEITNFYKILRKGGLVYVTTPNFNSLLRLKLKAAYNVITYPEHLSYYTPNSIKKLFKLNGFKKHKIKTTGISLTRFKTSSGKSNQKIISSKSDDEKIRKKIDSKWIYKFSRDITNQLLTFFGIGDSLKGWFIKQ